MADDAKQLAAPYMGFSSFKTALDQLSVVPLNRIDRSAFPGFAGSVQTQVLTTLRFLELISTDGKPLPRLHSVAVKDEGARKAALDPILRERYSKLFDLDLAKATPAQLAEEMAGFYGVAGETKEKAIRFFLSAVAYVGIPMSPLLMNAKGPNGPGGSRKRKAKPKPDTPKLPDIVPLSHVTADGETHSVQLRSGGTLTLAVSTKFFKLAAVDRAFVFSLLDMLQEYEQASQPAQELEIDPES